MNPCSPVTVLEDTDTPRFAVPVGFVAENDCVKLWLATPEASVVEIAACPRGAKLRLDKAWPTPVETVEVPQEDPASWLFDVPSAEATTPE